MRETRTQVHENNALCQLPDVGVGIGIAVAIGSLLIDPDTDADSDPEVFLLFVSMFEAVPHALWGAPGDA
jgi:hypothetical protein